MNISKLQKYKNASKIVTGMLAVTLSVGIMTSLSWAEEVDNINDVGVTMTALDDNGGEGSSNGGSTLEDSEFDNELNELEDKLILWKYKDEEQHCIYIKLKHYIDKCISRIEDEDGRERVSFKAGTQEVVARYELKEGDTKFKIVDQDGDYKWVNIDEIDLNVTRAYKNENGDVMAIAMTSNKKIVKVTYLDTTKEAKAIELELQNESKDHKMKWYSVDKGTTGVLVYLQDEQNDLADPEELQHPIEVQLALDWKAPEVERLYKNAANTKMILKAKDNESGIDKIVVDGRVITIQGTNRDITKIIESGVTQVKLYDAVGHETIVTAEEDATQPKVILEKVRNKDGAVENGKYKLTMRDHKSGLWKLESDSKSVTDKVLEEYKDFPQTEQTYTVDLNKLTDVSSVFVYDALGNIAKIDLENVTCIIVYTHSNVDGSKVAISLYEEGSSNRKIEKIGIINDAKECKIIEKMPANTTSVLRCYETPAGTTAIKIFYSGEDPISHEEYKPAEYVLDPYEEPLAVSGNRVGSLVGINRIEYSDGRKVEFTESMPTSVHVELNAGETATVYDALDNFTTIG